jgi:hypothetical protein
MQKFRELSEAIKISLETPEIKEKIEKLKNDYLLEEEKIYNSMMYMDNCYDFFVNAGNDYEFMIEEITIYNEELESMNKEINKPEVAEEKKENEKQEKTVVELESPKEKSKLDINEIDLAGIKILNGTKIFEVEAGYNQYLQKTLYSTFQVVLPLSNYEAHLRGLTLDEIDALKNSFADQFTVKQKLSETIYNCIEQTSIGKISYQDFLQYTVDTDFEILVYAVYNKTYGKINSFTITCPHCGVSHKREIPFNEIIQIKSEKILEKINEIQTTTTPKEFVLENYGFKQRKAIKLEDSQLIVEVGYKNIKDITEIDKLYRNSVELVETTSFSLLSSIHSVLIPSINSDGDIEGYVQIDNMIDKRKHLSKITEKDLQQIKKTKEQIVQDMMIEFNVSNIICQNPSCLSKIPDMPVDMVTNFLVQVLMGSANS